MLAEILDVVWPRACEVCGRPADRPGRHVCSDCLNRLPFLPLTGGCRLCGREATGLDVEYLCEDCRVRRPAFDRAASALRMEGVAREMLNAFKFRYHYWLRDDLVDFLEASVRSRFDVKGIDLVVAMPLTWRRLWNRGFNQCAVLAKPLARRLGKPCPPFVLRRKNAPKQQSRLGEEERRANVVNTFAVRFPQTVAGRTILLLDDVMTTGSTLSEGAAELKRAGASRVWCISLVRSVRP